MTFSPNRFPILDDAGFESLASRQDCLFPEPKTICVGTKLRRGVAAALAKAVEAQAKTRAALIETAIASWLRANGFLK